jgi:Mlc titration factor MtfA (ptsG expression regulator)
MDLWRRWRRALDERAAARHAIPDPLWRRTLRRYPFLQRRDPADEALLRHLTSLFLARKEFSGAGGLRVRDDMAVAIAAQACLPVLRLGLDGYDSFVGIVVHPDQVVARREEVDEDGVVHTYDEPLAGEAMAGGPVMLSWHDVRAAGPGSRAGVGYNVVIHEFAHVLDLQDGVSDGTPPQPDPRALARWRTTLNEEFQRLVDAVDRGEDTAIDPYGATGPDEFFAVTAELFFVAPWSLQREHPALYGLLRDYFGQDPAVEMPAPRD